MSSKYVYRMNNQNGTDYIQEAIIKLKKWPWVGRQSRMVYESILLGDITAAKRRGYTVVWNKKGALYIPFSSYEVK